MAIGLGYRLKGVAVFIDGPTHDVFTHVLQMGLFAYFSQLPVEDPKRY